MGVDGPGVYVRKSRPRAHRFSRRKAMETTAPPARAESKWFLGFEPPRAGVRKDCHIFARHLATCGPQTPIHPLPGDCLSATRGKRPFHPVACFEQDWVFFLHQIHFH